MSLGGVKGDQTILAQKDSIHFLLGMKDMVPDLKGKGELDKLICEEMDHVRMLSQARKRCQPSRCDIISRS